MRRTIILFMILWRSEGNFSKLKYVTFPFQCILLNWRSNWKKNRRRTRLYGCPLATSWLEPQVDARVPRRNAFPVVPCPNYRLNTWVSWQWSYRVLISGNFTKRHGGILANIITIADVKSVHLSLLWMGFPGKMKINSWFLFLLIWTPLEVSYYNSRSSHCVVLYTTYPLRNWTYLQGMDPPNIRPVCLGVAPLFQTWIISLEYWRIQSAMSWGKRTEFPQIPSSKFPDMIKKSP